MAVFQLTKGDKVALIGFTGIYLAEMEISKATKKEFTVVKRDGKEMVFDKETGIQTNVEEGKEKYANRIVHPSEIEDGKWTGKEKKEEKKEEEKPKKKAPAKKKASKKKVEEVVEIEEEDDEEYEEL